MAIKKIRFPLEMDNGAEARILDELREHFSMEKVVLYYSEGKLLKWLRNNYLDEEAEAISELDPKDPELNQKICGIFDVEYNESAKVDIEKVTANKQRLSRLKEYTSDEKFDDVIDRVAFDQNELEELLNNGASEVYLCGSWFHIPLDRENVRYIGINQPIAEINSAEMVDFKAKNISFENLKFNKEYTEIVEKRRFDADFSGSADDWTEPQIKHCRKCLELNKKNDVEICEKLVADGYVHYSLVLLDYVHDYYHEDNYYSYKIDISGMSDISNLITIIADNTRYMKKYMDMSKEKIKILKMGHCEYNGYEMKTPNELLRYSGLVLINNLKKESDLIDAGVFFTGASKAYSKVYNDIAEIKYYGNADVIGVWVSESVNQKIVSYAIKKKVAEEFNGECEYQGYILPFDIMRDIISDKDTILISEKCRNLTLYRDTKNYGSWLVRYGGEEFGEGNRIYMSGSDMDHGLRANDYIPVKNISRLKTNEKNKKIMYCSKCGAKIGSDELTKCPYCSCKLKIAGSEAIKSEEKAVKTSNEEIVEMPISEVSKVVKSNSEADYEECYKGFCLACGKYIEIDESMIDDYGCAECPNCEEEIDVDDIEDIFEGNCPECGEYIEFYSDEIDDDDGVYCPKCGETFDIEDFVAENYDDDDDITYIKKNKGQVKLWITTHLKQSWQGTLMQDFRSFISILTRRKRLIG